MFKYKHIDRQTNRQPYRRQTDKQKDKHPDVQSDSNKHKRDKYKTDKIEAGKNGWNIKTRMEVFERQKTERYLTN